MAEASPEYTLSERIARAAVRAVRAHETHYPVVGDRSKVGCRGSSDPLTGHFCQFLGTAKEQAAHQYERTEAVVRAVLIDEGVDRA